MSSTNDTPIDQKVEQTKNSLSSFLISGEKSGMPPHRASEGGAPSSNAPPVPSSKPRLTSRMSSKTAFLERSMSLDAKSEEVPPSKVLFLNRLPKFAGEDDVRSQVKKFGAVKNMVLIARRHQALVEMESLNDAIKLVGTAIITPLQVNGSDIEVKFSTKQEIEEPKEQPTAMLTRQLSRSRSSSLGFNPNETPNNILLVTVQDACWPITTELLTTVFKEFGELKKIVVFMKTAGVQALIQFTAKDEAILARNKLQGKSVYPGCCTLSIGFSKLEDLVVHKNSMRSWDFTNPNLPRVENDTAVNAQPQTRNRSGSSQSGRNRAVSLPLLPPTSQSEATPVILVTNLDNQVEVDNIFNLYSSYGNILRIRKLHNKEGHALIQFETTGGAQLAIHHLDGRTLFGEPMEIRTSNHQSINPVTNASEDEGYKNAQEFARQDFRFTNRTTTRNVMAPVKLLHVSNIDRDMSESDLRDHFEEIAADYPIENMKTFVANDRKQGLIEYKDADAASDVLALSHRSELNGRTIRVAFSQSNL